MKKLAALLFITLLSVMCIGEASADETVSRISGSSRYHTAVEISKEGWKEGANFVILARGDSYPDALAGVPLAKDLDAPILLTSPDELHSATEKEIKRLEPSMVILLGGKQAIDTSIEEEIEDKGIKAVRVSGSDRYSTSVQIAKLLDSSKEKAVIVTGKDFPDALSVAPFAAEKGYPILLTDPKSLPNQVKEYVADYQSTLVVGGTAAISKTVEEALPKPERISGRDRYQTAANLIQDNYEENNQLYISTGESFADALTGSVLAANNRTAVMLVEADKVPGNVEGLLKSQKVNYLTIFGGTAAVGDTVAKKMKQMINLQQSSFTSYFPSHPKVSIFDRGDSYKYDVIDYKIAENGYYYLWFIWNDFNHPESVDYFEDETGLYAVSNVTDTKHLMVEYPAKAGAKRHIEFLYATYDEENRNQTIEVMKVTSDSYTYKVSEGGGVVTYTVKEGKGIVDSDYVDLKFPITAEEAVRIIDIGTTSEEGPVHFPKYDTDEYYCIGVEFYEGYWSYLEVNKQTGQYKYLEQ
ncbi:cell wall-binding repeat-containing protein [Rossellomorea aquimaris]|uniref:N-acetylmuramoyl-L-alanine amidase n=1 Tax=Rossellomorea aquimaris TaxID=189382 RepID=A0A5D4TVY6_9BACI|nr:cell wall-binding repeat-containing protein [Rossellomorea aquimaris]TYS78534.1 hypothetical protein FZC80_12385 [Rossellomorea aquimaris]